jgi:hypothetical protein
MPAATLPAYINLGAYHGDSWAQTFRLLTAPDTPVDLTGATVQSWVINGDGTSTPLQVTVGPDPGTITLELPVAGLPVAAYRYDVEVTDALAAVTTWIRGSLTVQQDVTNA